MSRLSAISILLVLLIGSPLGTASPGLFLTGHARAAQQASPVAGSTGGTLYTFDSGEAGFFTKTYFYDTGAEVVAFDAQFTPQLAEEAIAFLRTQTDNPITYLV